MFLLCATLFYSCEKNEPATETIKQPPLFPLNVGNKWTYEQTSNISSNPNTTTIELEVKSYTINGQKGFAFQEYTKGQPFSLLESDDEGNCVEYFFDKEVLVHKTIFYKKNVETNGKWIYKSAVYTDDNYSKWLCFTIM